MGFGPAIQHGSAAALGLPVENSLKAVFDKALAQVFHGTSTHPDGVKDLLVGPAAVRVKKRLGPFSLLRGMLSFVEDFLKPGDFPGSQGYAVKLPHGHSSGPG